MQGRIAIRLNGGGRSAKRGNCEPSREVACPNRGSQRVFPSIRKRKTASCRASIFDARLTKQTLLQAAHATYAPGAHLSSLGVALPIGFHQSQGCRGYGGARAPNPCHGTPGPYRLFASNRGRSPHKLAVISSSPPRRPVRTPNLVI